MIGSRDHIMTMSIITIGGDTKWLPEIKRAFMMKLVRLPIYRPLLLNFEILCRFENSKNLKALYDWVASLATHLLPSHTNPLNISNFQTFIKSHAQQRSKNFISWNHFVTPPFSYD